MWRQWPQHQRWQQHRWPQQQQWPRQQWLQQQPWLRQQPWPQQQQWPPQQQQLRFPVQAPQRFLSVGATATTILVPVFVADSGATSPTAQLSFTLDSGASICFFRDCADLTRLHTPVTIALADPSVGSVVAHITTILPCPAAPSGFLTCYYTPSFSRNLVGVSHLHELGVVTTFPLDEPVASCIVGATGVPLATFHREPGSGLYSLHTGSHRIGSGQVAAVSCDCWSLTHPSVLWHHRLGDTSFPRLSRMVCHRLVSVLPKSLAPLPRSPAPPCTPCVEGRQRAAPHSSSFPPTTAPFQTLHLDVWGPSPILGPRQECYFLIVVDDYSHYTTVLPLRRKADVPTVLEPWLLGIAKSYMLPASPQQNGVAERRIGLVMEVARTSMCHASTPLFLWLQAVRYAAHQLNLWPSDARPRVTPVSLWTGSPGVAADYHVWGSLAHVRAPSANKLSARTRACVFLGFPLDTSGWQFYDPVTCQFVSSQDVTFDESVSYYRSRPHRGSETFSPPLFLTTEPPPVAPVAPPPSRPALSGVSHVTPQSSPPQRPDPTVSGGAGGAVAEGEGTGAAGAGGVGFGGARGVGVEVTPVEDTAASSRRTHPASPPGFPFVLQFPPRSSLRPVAAEPGGVAARGTGCPEGVGGGGCGSGGAGVGGTGTVAPTLRTVCFLTREPRLLQLEREEHERFERAQQQQEQPQSQQQKERVEEESQHRVVSLEPRRSRYRVDGPFHLVLRSRVPPPPVLPQPPESSLTVLHDPLSDYLRASRPVVSRVLSALVTHPTAPVLSVSALVTTIAGFASSHCLDYASHLVSGTSQSPSTGGVPDFPLEVLEDRQFELGFLAATVPHLCAMLLALEGDPDALDIPIPRNHAEAVSGPWASYWIAAEEAEMASYRSTSTYVDAVPPPGTKVVSGMWLYKVKRPPGSPPVFKARYVARGFSQRKGVDFFQTFAPTPKMTTLQVLLHIAAQRDFKLHSLDFSTAFLQGSLHEQIWLRRPPCFIGSFPPGTYCEAKLYTAAMAAQELCWLSFLLTNVGERPRSPPFLFANNRSAVLLCEEPRLVGKAKHIQLRYFLLREFQQRGQALVALWPLASVEMLVMHVLYSCISYIYHIIACGLALWPLASGGARVTGAAGAGGARAGGAGGTGGTGAGRAGGAGARGTGAGGSGTVGTTDSLTGRREPASRPASPVCTVSHARRVCLPPVPGTHTMALRPSSVSQRVALPSPLASSLPGVPDPESDLARAASPIVTRVLATLVTDPSFESTAASALVTGLADFAATCRLDYFVRLFTESECPLSVGGELALGSDVLEDRQFELECLAVAVPHLASMLLCPEGDPDALDIPTLRSYAEAITVYGLRQAPREWHDTLRTTLAALGFSPLIADPSLFLRTNPSLPPFYILVYVNDLVFTTFDTKALALVKAELQKRYACTDMGDLQSYLGLLITRDRARRTITLTQSHVVHQVLQRFGFQFSSSQSTPLPTNHSLSAPPSDESVEPSGQYPELVGCLTHLTTCTQPDLAYPLSILARYIAPRRHRQAHWQAARTVLRDLCSTSGMGLVLGGRGPVVFSGHSDASWADDQET
ncbi:unnamed protein product [Closterium sp. NIES-54]